MRFNPLLRFCVRCFHCVFESCVLRIVMKSIECCSSILFLYSQFSVTSFPWKNLLPPVLFLFCWKRFCWELLEFDLPVILLSVVNCENFCGRWLAVGEFLLPSLLLEYVRRLQVIFLEGFKSSVWRSLKGAVGWKLLKIGSSGNWRLKFIGIFLGWFQLAFFRLELVSKGSKGDSAFFLEAQLEKN